MTSNIMHISSSLSWQHLALCRRASTAQQSSYQLNQAWNFKAERKNESQEVFNYFCSSMFTNCVNFTPALLIPPPALRDPSPCPSLTTWRTPPCSKTFSTLWTSPPVKIPICHQSTMPPTPATSIFHQSTPPTFPHSISKAQIWANSYHGRLVPLDSCNLFPTSCGWDEILSILAKYFWIDLRWTTGTWTSMCFGWTRFSTLCFLLFFLLFSTSWWVLCSRKKQDSASLKSKTFLH